MQNSGSFTSNTNVTTTSAFNVAYGRLFMEQFAVGTGVKYLLENNNAKRSAFDLDLGTSWRSPYRFAVAAVGENLLRSKLKSDQPGLTAHLSRKFRLAGAYFLPMTSSSGALVAGWQLEQAGETTTNNTSLFNFGTEWWVGTASSLSLGLRGGYTFGKSTLSDRVTDFQRWNTGFSVNLNMQGRDLRLDYGFRMYPYESTEALPADNFLSVTYGWGGVPDYASKQPQDEKYELAQQPIHGLTTKPQTAQAPPQAVKKTEVAEKPTAPPPAPQASVEPKPAAKPADIVQAPQPEAAKPAHEPVAVTPAQPPSAPKPAEKPVVSAQLPQTPAVTKPVGAPVETPQVTQKPAEVKPADKPVEVAQAQPIQPVEEPPTQEAAISFTKLDLELDFSQLNLGSETRIVFYLRPKGILGLTSWKLHVFSARLKDWEGQKAESFAIHTISGIGLPPINVVWNGILDSKQLIRPGKYFFIVTGIDKYGQHYKSEWCRFKVE